jgi:surface antigen
MNKNHKTKKSNLFLTVAPKLFLTIFVASILSLGASNVVSVRADRFQEQINQLNAQNSATRQSINHLSAEAANYQDVINKLQQQINAMQAQIAANEQRVADLQNQIAQAEEELAKQKRLLGTNIRAMYVESDISTLEMLASSRDLSDFVDKQQYRNSVKNKIKQTLDRITELRHQLKAQKDALDQTIRDQQAIRDQLAAQQGEHNALLAMNQQQQSELNNQIRANNDRIAELRRQQAAENAIIFGGRVPTGIPGGGGYPGKWAFAPIDSIVDSWGMYNRQCVSYAAWKVWSTGRYMPYWGGRGNANQWDDNARAAGIPVDTNPQPGSVAIKNAGFYGHAMYVEHVYGDGTIYVSQYNAGWDGNYSEARISAAGLVFIHF